MSAPNWGEELRDELLCPICLDSFKDPVILDCGHNFCQVCITDCWEVSGTGVCPQCRKSLPGGELRPNKSLEEAVKIARGLDGECEKHEEVFSLFCRQDRTLICRVCRVSRAHRAHTVIPIEAAAKECKEQLLSHLSRFQRVRDERGRWAAAEEGKYQTLLEKTERQKQEIVSEFKQAHQILKQGEQLLRNCLEGTIQDLVKTRNKNTKGLLLLDSQIAELNQKCQQPEIELLKDIGSTLSRCEQVKGEEEAPVDSLTELESKVQALSESQKVLRDLLKNFRVELAPELGPLENLPSEVKRQVNSEDPTENVPNNREQDDTSLCLLDWEDGKLNSDRCEKQEVIPTDGQYLTAFINVEPKEARVAEYSVSEPAPNISLTNVSGTLNLLDNKQVVRCSPVELAPELGPLENLSSEVQRQVSGEDPTEDVPDNAEQDDTSLCLLDCEDGKLNSDSCQEQEVVPTDGQNNLTNFINVEPAEARVAEYSVSEPAPNISLTNVSGTLNLLDNKQVIHRSPGHWFDSKVRRRGAWTIVAAVIVLAVILIPVIAWSVSKARVTPPDRPAACCPEKWIGYHGKCYFFSDDEADWTSSQHFCSSHGASLAWLDTLQEKDFLMRHKGNLDPWIGVRKEPGQPWKWTNGSAFSDLFQIGGGGDCAYIYDITVSSSTCDTKRNWICSKPDEFAKREIS